MSIIKGGAAGFNSVLFYSDNFSSKAIREKDGTLKIELSNRKSVSNFERMIKRIPIIRGLFIFVKPAIVMWKVILIVFLPVLVLLLLSSGSSESATNSSFIQILSIMTNVIDNHFWLLIAITLMIYAAIIKLSDLGKYHGAEHMTDSCFNSLSSLVISDVAKQPRIHKHCGTNFVIFLFVVVFILSFLISNYIVIALLSVCLAYEAFLIQSRIMTPFYWIGGLFQYLFFTSKPSTEHLEVAVASYEALIEAEIKYSKGKA
ncbi:uncharacterized protein YqhQ [Evansella vedderi]|uniref:Uncharacterized protein YqhQ n=1 Tax=Evansella vedderi TaxID=38282 RepID=A0ABU0A0V0_9BACI|nr:DUF1385 domain-containing protein [Evansella vedderi]MDQ0257085.1 uncharacterized protein YqhQ [Evansella vedderi]